MLKKLGQIIAIALILLATVNLPVLAASTPAITHSISGTITLNGSAFKGVTVKVKGTTFSAVTNGLGNYRIASVPGGTSGTLVPTLTNYTFSPVNIKFTALAANLTAQNFTATQAPAGFYMISGAIRLAGVGLPGVTVHFSTFTAVTDSLGIYRFKNIPGGTTAHILPVLSGYGFSPSYIPVSNLSANLGSQKFTATVLLTVSGIVTDSGTGLPLGGVTVSLGSLSAVSAAVTGAYNIRNVPVGTSGDLTPSLVGETFAPLSIPITNLQTSVHSQNFVATP